ncbi:MAG: Trm112 family protein [Candidatus Omnitrophica bacterium]|nr:Trm112 family protein [Candidatus Omnitrophota bacterium]
MISKELLEILACPVCKEAVKLESERLICPKCHRKYPIKDGIPVMLVEEAEELEPKK